MNELLDYLTKQFALFDMWLNHLPDGQQSLVVWVITSTILCLCLLPGHLFSGIATVIEKRSQKQILVPSSQEISIPKGALSRVNSPKDQPNQSSIGIVREKHP